MTDPTPELLSLPALETARRLALARLEEWDQARARLADAADTEALHDFRVGLRRLRSVIRAFRQACPELVPPKARRGLRRLARATGTSRDLEVQRAWITARLPELSPAERRDGRGLLARLAAEEAGARDRLRRRVGREFDRLHQRLWEALATAPVDTTEATGPGTAATLAAALAGWTERLEYRLARIHGIADEAEAHAARILIKRLRYLLEPFRGELAGAESMIERLKQLQDLLGELHDLLGLADMLRTALRAAAVEEAERTYAALVPWADPATAAAPPFTRRGPAALLQRVRQAAEDRFEQTREFLASGAGRELCADLVALGQAAAGRREPGIEIERKYLLSAAPPHALTVPPLEIEQGWLPGQTLVERIRRVRSAEGEAWFRTVKTGTGVRRVEIEEEIGAELFQSLWPLTEGRRVRKQRYRVPQGAVAWEVDRFLDRELAVAEIELTDEAAPVEIPAWLAPYLVREVTAEPEFTNRALAR